MAGSGRVGWKALEFYYDFFFFLKLWFNRKPAPIRFGCSIKPKFKKKAGLPSIQPEKPETEMIEPVLLNQWYLELQKNLIFVRIWGTTNTIHTVMLEFLEASCFLKKLRFLQTVRATYTSSFFSFFFFLFFFFFKNQWKPHTFDILLTLYSLFFFSFFHFRRSLLLVLLRYK